MKLDPTSRSPDLDVLVHDATGVTLELIRALLGPAEELTEEGILRVLHGDDDDSTRRAA
jgi:hypothetical protein